MVGDRHPSYPIPLPTSPLKGEEHHLSPPLQGLCHNGGNAMFVILNEVKNLMISTESIIEILRLTPQNDITTYKGLKKRYVVLNNGASI